MLAVRGRGPSTPLRAGPSTLPLAYFALAHLSLALGLAILAIDPRLPGAFFYHPRMIAVVHLLTLGWITASILGAFYIVGPYALGMTMTVTRRDWIGFAAFWLGVTGMVTHFWMASYDGMGWSATLVIGAIANLAPRGCHGISCSVPWAIRVHVRLAFSNMLFAGLLGVIIAFDKSRGIIGISPLSATFAHAHLAAVGWGVMMVMGLSQRLVPMMLPAAPPRGRLAAAPAVLVETGLVLLVPSLIFQWPLVLPAAAITTAGLGAFALLLLRTAVARLPRPPALPVRDWSVWQVHASFAWLLVAVVLGLYLSRAGVSALQAAWVYGVAGLMGFLAQVISGMHGRLLPFHAWHLASVHGRPRRSAHALIDPRLASIVFWCWNLGLPALGAGLAMSHAGLIRISTLLLLAGLAAGALHSVTMLLGAFRAIRKDPDASASRSPRASVTHHAH